MNNLIVSILDPSKDNRWDKFVYKHENGTIFHTSAWSNVICHTYGYQPLYLVLEDQTHSILAGMPLMFINSILTGKRLVGLPFTDVCIPLVDSREQMKLLIIKAIALLRELKAKYIEVRDLGFIDLPNEIRFDCHDYYKLLVLNIVDDLDKLWASFHSGVKKGIKKAQNSNLSTRFAENESDLKAFYDLNISTRKKHGIFPQPYMLFRNIWDEIILKNNGFLLMVEKDKTLLAAGVFFIYKSKMDIKYAASNIKHLKESPNNLLYWEAIKYAQNKRLDFFDFGRTSPENIGLMSFKRRWGTEQYSLPYYYWPSVQGVVSTKETGLKYKIISTALCRTPEMILKYTGSFIYGHLG